MGLSRLHPSFPWTLIQGVKSLREALMWFQPDWAAWRLRDAPSPSWRLGCPVWPRGSKAQCSLSVRVSGARHCQALPAGWTPPPPRDPQHLHSLHPPIIRQHNAPTSRQPAGCHFGACTLRLFPHRVVFKGVLFDLVGLFPPLVDWQRSDAAFDKSQDCCTVPGMADAGS